MALVGGLMVQLHSYERESDARATTDIDFLGNSGRRLGTTQRIAATLEKLGGKMKMPSADAEDLGYQFDLDGEIVEVVGSEGERADPKTAGKYRTIQVPGGRQALRRTETVLVSLHGAPAVELRRPGLLGAILIKARAVAEMRSEKFDSDREDLIRLLSFVEDPRALAIDSGLKSRSGSGCDRSRRSSTSRTPF